MLSEAVTSESLWVVIATVSAISARICHDTLLLRTKVTLQNKVMHGVVPAWLSWLLPVNNSSQVSHLYKQTYAMPMIHIAKRNDLRLENVHAIDSQTFLSENIVL
eukprot:862758-Amphidinium_carterae.1